MSDSTVPAKVARKRFSFDWRRDIIYVGFVAVLIIFSVLLRDQGFLSCPQPASGTSSVKRPSSR